MPDWRRSSMPLINASVTPTRRSQACSRIAPPSELACCGSNFAATGRPHKSQKQDTLSCVVVGHAKASRVVESLVAKLFHHAWGFCYSVAQCASRIMQAGRAIKVIKQREKMTGRALPYAVLLTRRNPVIRTRTMSHIQQGLIEAGIPVMQTELHDREAFRAVFSFRQTLQGLDPREVANLDKAQANVEEYATEIVRGLSAATGANKTGVKVA